MAVKEPLPYYIPEATISVASTGTCAAVATNPVFTSAGVEGTSSIETSLTSMTTADVGTGRASVTSMGRGTGTSASSEGPARQTSTNEAKRLEGRWVLGGLGCGLGVVMVWL